MTMLNSRDMFASEMYLLFHSIHVYEFFINAILILSFYGKPIVQVLLVYVLQYTAACVVCTCWEQIPYALYRTAAKS